MVLIDNTKNANINDMLKIAIKNNNVEFELIYGRLFKKDISKENFIDILNYCKDTYDITETDVNLDISYLDPNKSKSQLNNYRLTISNTVDIKKYCNTNIINTDMDINIIEKKPYKNDIFNIPNTYKNGDYNYKINLKTEDNISENIQELLDSFNNSKKYFRYKKRYSFLPDNKLWRIDLTVTKNSKYNEKFKTPDYSESFKKADILNSEENYEIEIEYVGSNIKLNSGLYAIESFIKNNDLEEPKIDKTKIYNPFIKNQNKDYTYDKDDINVKIEDYIGKSVNILDSYWDKNTDEKIKDDFIDKNLTILEVFYDYDGDYGNGTYLKIETNDNINIIVPIVDLDINENIKVGGSSSSSELTFESVDIEELDLANFPVPDSLDEYIPEKWFPNIETILNQTIYNMNKKPQKDSIDYFQLLHLFKYIDMNKELILKSDIASKYGLESVEKIKPYIIYDNNSYIIKYEILQTNKEKLSLDILVEQNYDIIDNLLEILEDILYNIIRIKTKEEIIISNKSRNDVVKEYYTLSNQNKKYYKNFVGPQPRQLKIENLYVDNPINILENYLVTEKADGDRYSLYINKQKILYLVNKKNEVIDTGLKIPSIKGEWLLDGEYIKKDKLYEDIKLFMIFDVYYCEESLYKNPYKLPFLSDTDMDRMTILNKFKEYLNDVEIHSEYIDDETRLQIEFKSYQKGFINNKKDISNALKKKLYNTIFVQSSQIWKNRENFKYNIDGLIYLPSNLPVKSNLDGLPTNNIFGTWELNFKWKPAYENTIDFQIEIRKESKKDKVFPFIKKVGNKEVLSKYKQILLLVKYYKKKDNTIDHCMAILSDKTTKYKDEELIPFSPLNYKENAITNIELTDNKLYTLKDKREIKNGDIVEMRYNPESKNSLGPWEPLRIRSDKPEPQPFHISNDIWYTIQNEVSEEMISGDIDIFTEYENKNYYDTENIYTHSTPLRKFHNLVKSKLIGLIGYNTDTQINIIDTSIGRGGDIKKYLIKYNSDISCNYLFGLDISPVDEACKRFYEEDSKNTKAVFIQYDTSKSIENEKGYLGSEKDIKHSQNIMNILYNKKQSIPKEYEIARTNYNSIAVNGFDLVSCQFTLHYYFKSEKTLRTYLENISYVCKKGGYFIGTCYDGNKILELFGDKNIVQYTKNQDLVYKLEKIKISDFIYDKNDISNMFGNSINVFMDSIGDTYLEYLVNFKFFIDIMKEYGFELYKPEKNKKKYYPFINNSIDSFERILNNLPKIKDDIDLNRFYKKSLEMLKDKDLYNLSKTNNYFIFKKL